MLETFINDCTAFKPGDKDAFKRLLNETHLTKVSVATHLEVAPSTVTRWANGQVVPHVVVQKAVVRYLKREAKRVKAATASAAGYNDSQPPVAMVAKER